MSRTHRCKGYEQTKNRSADKQGSKTNGFYTERVWVAIGLVTYRPMTAQEKAKKYHEIHGESKYNNDRGPARWFRAEFHKENNRHNDAEMRRYLNDAGGYDPVFIAKFPSQSRWWEVY